VINTGTTIVTFLMFVIQNTQNRDKAATQIKELARAPAPILCASG